MTAQVLQFPVIPIKPADRQLYQSYVCPKCGEQGEARVMWVLPTLFCDGCGAEMRPVEAK